MRRAEPRAVVVALVGIILLLSAPSGMVLDDGDADYDGSGLGLDGHASRGGAKSIVIDEFQGGLSEGTLTFEGAAYNTTLALEVTRGATITSSHLTLEGIPSWTGGCTRYDFQNAPLGSDLWIKYHDTFDRYPPSFDPYNTGWNTPPKVAYNLLKRSDDTYWTVFTASESLPPPVEWPVQLFHFRPQFQGASTIMVTWEGYSHCGANGTNEYHCEMWLYNHTSRGWEEVKSYGRNLAGDVHLNHTFDVTSPYLSANGSIDVAIFGIHAEGRINPLPPVSDYGRLYTDYMGVLGFLQGSLRHPEDVNLTIGGTSVYNMTGSFDRSVELGGTSDLRDAIQSVVDSNEVRPGNITIPLNLSVREATPGLVRVSNLIVEYEPVTNGPPDWQGPSTLWVDEDSSWTSLLDLNGAFNDDHNEGALTFEVMSISDPANLSVRIVRFNGPEGFMEVRPAADFFGEVDVVVRAHDLFGATADSPPIKIVVNQTADPPSIVDPGEKGTMEEEAIDFTMEVDDPDKPDDVFTWTDNSAYLDIDPSTGRINWTPNETQVGEHSFEVAVEDRFGLTSTLMVTILVTNVNNPPEIVSDLVVEAVQDEPAVYEIVVRDPDLPDHDEHTYYALSDFMEVACDPATGEVTFTPTNDNVPSTFITVGVEDSAGEVDEVELWVHVTNVNDPPVLEELVPEEVNQGDEVTHQLVFDDPDLDIIWALPEPPDELTLSYDGPAAFAVDQDGIISFVAVPGLVGTHPVVYTVTDLGGLNDSITVTWTILDVNDAPVITTHPPSVVQATEDETFTLTIEASDIDGDAIQWSDDTTMFDIDPESGLISFTPLQVHVGTHRIIVTASDGRGGSDTALFDLVVANVNDAPVITSVLPEDGSRYREGKTIVFVATATDEDGDALSYTWLTGDGEMGTGPEVDHRDLTADTHQITLLVTDGNATAEHRFSVVVEERTDELEPGTVLAIIVLLIVVSVIAPAWFLHRTIEGTEPSEAARTRDDNDDGPQDGLGSSDDGPDGEQEVSNDITDHEV